MDLCSTGSAANPLERPGLGGGRCGPKRLLGPSQVGRPLPLAGWPARDWWRSAIQPMRRLHFYNEAPGSSASAGGLRHRQTGWCADRQIYDHFIADWRLPAPGTVARARLAPRWLRAGGARYWRGSGAGLRLGSGISAWRPHAPSHPEASVSHLQLVRSDAYARLGGARLPAKAEWEAVAAAESSPGGADGVGERGSQSGMGCSLAWTPVPTGTLPGLPPGGRLRGRIQRASFMSYPDGAFARRQFSWTPGAACAPTYRNFFPRATAGMASGLRLARDGPS